MKNRARNLLLSIPQRARDRRVGVANLGSADYLNTIAPDAEPVFPGDEHIERRIRAYNRWNAAFMVHRAQRRRASTARGSGRCRRPEWSPRADYQFAGGSLAGNESSPHTSTMSRSGDVAGSRRCSSSSRRYACEPAACRSGGALGGTTGSMSVIETSSSPRISEPRYLTPPGPHHSNDADSHAG